jgi:dipeptidyl aminopeptidase/acylaminoacyl peptidase
MRSDGKELSPSSSSIRSLLREYGGGDFTLVNDRLISTASQGLFLDGTLLAKPKARFGDIIAGKGCIYACMEEEGKESLITCSLQGELSALHTSYDCYGSPALSPCGNKLAFLGWNLPHMPWEQNDLVILDLTSGEATCVASGASHFQPSWDENGALFFISDVSGYWNLYDERGENLFPMEADFGEAQWTCGMSRYAHTPVGIAAIYTEKGVDSLALLTDQLTRIDLPFTAYRNLVASHSHLYFVAASPELPEALYSYELKSETLKALRETSTLTCDTISLPEPFEFESEGVSAYGIYYPPHKLEEGPPPLIVRCHGGPTTHAKPLFDLRTQLLTSRGYGVVDINYGGSTGYGKAYRNRLSGKWGIVDVADAIAGARALIDAGKGDSSRLCITGRSAGGFTALAALAASPLFTCGISWYGVSDLAALAATTHRFESGYLTTLIGSDPTLLTSRSPLANADAITAPLLLLQGSDDAVVPPQQTEKLARALRTRGLFVEVELFEGEGHGFRSSDAIERAASAELTFLQKVFT